MDRFTDPDDRRAQRIRLTDAGLDAAQRMWEASHRGIEQAVAHWTSEDRHRLAALFHRLVDDFIAHAGDEIDAPPASASSPGAYGLPAGGEEAAARAQRHQAHGDGGHDPLHAVDGEVADRRDGAVEQEQEPEHRPR